MNFFTLVFVLFLCLSCNSNQSGKPLNSDKVGLDTLADIYTVTPEDTSMNSAIDKAKRTIAEFDRALKSNNPSYTDFALKKRFRTPDDGGEHMWIAGLRLIEGGYKGFVNSDAEETTEVKYGDSVIVQKEDITDWMYLDNNALRGGYTIREVRNKLSKEERNKMDKNIRFKIED